MPIPNPVNARGLSRPGARIPKRHRRVPADAILGITKPAIRRLARRGGVYRIQSEIYDTIRGALKAKLEAILRRIIISMQAYASDRDLGDDSRARKTITTMDVIFALKGMGTPIYGFHEVQEYEDNQPN